MTFDPTSVAVTCVTEWPKDHWSPSPMKMTVKVCDFIYLNQGFVLQTWTKGQLTPRCSFFDPIICCGHKCDSTQGSLCPSPMKIASKYVDTVNLFAKTWTKGHWPLDDLCTPHACWGQHVWALTHMDHFVQVPREYINSHALDTVINFAKITTNIHIHTDILHTDMRGWQGYIHILHTESVIT